MGEGVALAASDSVAREAAEQAAWGGASALHVALSGYFAAAGAHPGVLLGPLSLLLFGFGARRAFDGRVRQPGLGVKRPRGFLPEQTIPQAARVGVPASCVAAFVALAYDTASARAQVTKVGVSIAKKSGAARRAELLERLSRLGASAFTVVDVHGPLLREAGLAERGLLTPEDFARTPEVDLKCAEASLDSHTTLTLPWARPTGSHESICVIDQRGTAVCLAYETHQAGLEIPEWEVLAPSLAEPVMRGIARVAPGEPLASPAQLSIELDSAGRTVAVKAGTEAPLRVLRPER